MKRVMILAIVLAMVLCLAGTALAAEPKPPTQLCLKMHQWGDNFVLLNKSMGTVKTSEGPVKFYAIHGEQYWPGYSLAVSGTGHVKGGVYHFSVSGSYLSGGTEYTYLTEMKWNLTTLTGTYSTRLMRSDGTSSLYTGTLDQLVCTDCTIPY